MGSSRTELLATIARVQRAMPRNVDVMAICEALGNAITATIVEPPNALQPPCNALQPPRNALQGALQGECNALQDERAEVRRAQNVARVRKHRAARASRPSGTV
jgi:hypothetical protein